MDGRNGAAAGGRRGNKVDITHLVDFSFPPREEPPQDGPTWRVRRVRHQNPPRHKEQHVHANYRLVLRPGTDARLYAANPDAHVAWDAVFQVLVPAETALVCAVCLENATAPRVTRCGHVYCLPCVLRYLSLGAKRWRTCPVCYEMVYLADLRPARGILTRSLPPSGSYASVAAMVAEARAAGAADDPTLLNGLSDTRLLLMQRQSGCAVALPAGIDDAAAATAVPLVDAPGAQLFSRLLLGTNEYVRTELEAELCALEVLLVQAQLEAAQLPAPAVEPLGPPGSAGLLPLRPQPEPRDAPTPECRFIEIAAEHVLADLSALAAQKPTITPADAPQVSKSNTVYYFYQTNDGAACFLHPQDVKMLKAVFGTFREFPREICVPILARVESTMTADLRRRCPYLAHIPEGCDVSFLEVDLVGGGVMSLALASDAFSREWSARAARLWLAAETPGDSGEIVHDEQASEVLEVAEDRDAAFPALGAPEAPRSRPLGNVRSFARAAGRAPADRSWGSGANPTDSDGDSDDEYDMEHVSRRRRGNRGGWSLDLDAALQAPDSRASGSGTLPSLASRTSRGGASTVVLLSNGAQRRRQ